MRGRRTGGWRRLAWLALALAAPTPALAQSGCDDLSGQPVNVAVDWQTDIKPIINELKFPTGRCTSCHSGSDPGGGLDLSDDLQDAIYTIVRDSGLVDPGSFATSFFFAKVNCDDPGIGSRMPLAQTPLTVAQQGLIFDWIEQGALGEPGEPIERDFLFKDSAESLRIGRLPP